MPARTPPHAGDRGSAAATLAICAAVVILLAAALIGGIAGEISQQASACQSQPPPGAAAAAIPASYLALYRKAGAAYGIPWTVLAGIGEVESDHGRSTLPGVHSGTNPWGAAGPMQFGVGGAAGNTWGGTPVHPASQQTGGYGIDGDGDGDVNVYDPGDAIPSAARYLQANGAPASMRAAIFAYNHATWYVDEVLSWAARYATGGALVISAAGSPICLRAAIGPLPAGAAGKVIAFALAQMGKPYQWGATGPGAYDCSGLAMMAYRAAGITIPRTAALQWAFGRQIPASQARPGDLVFFAGADGTMTAPGHVGIVISSGVMIHSPTTGQFVSRQNFAGSADLVGFTRP